MRVSPWSEKARWALDHRGVPYSYAEYLPMLGELPLRVRAGKMRGKITVPILFDGERVLDDSFAIARFADASGSGARLFPHAHEAAIVGWNAKSDALLTSGRALVLRKLAEDREAQRESLPSFVPGAVRGASAFVAETAARYLAKKHGTSDADLDASTRAIDDVLAGLRAALGGKTYLLGEFSYADIAMAVGLQMVAPVANAFVPLGPATRRCWSVPSLASKYTDLVAWRDELYAKHRHLQRGSGAS